MLQQACMLSAVGGNQAVQSHLYMALQNSSSDVHMTAPGGGLQEHPHNFSCLALHSLYPHTRTLPACKCSPRSAIHNMHGPRIAGSLPTCQGQLAAIQD